MNQHAAKRMAAGMALAGMGALAGCAGMGAGAGASVGTGTGAGGQGAPLYRCEHGIEFTARFKDGTAVLKGTRAEEVLLRDAGGQGAQQTVFSNPRLRAEFGLGAGAREALLHYFKPPLVARCLRD